MDGGPNGGFQAEEVVVYRTRPTFPFRGPQANRPTDQQPGLDGSFRDEGTLSGNSTAGEVVVSPHLREWEKYAVMGKIRSPRQLVRM